MYIIMKKEVKTVRIKIHNFNSGDMEKIRRFFSKELETKEIEFTGNVE